MFVGDFEYQEVTLITVEGKTTTLKKVRTICLVLKDDAHKNWSYDIPAIVYDPESPYSLLGIPFLGRYFDKNNDTNDFETPRYYLHQTTPFSNGTMANINDILPMETVIYQNY
jgi:hypothetical protein